MLPKIKNGPNGPEPHVSNDNRKCGKVDAISLQQRETADYVCDMVLELRNAVLACQLTELAEVLKQAYYKAYSVSHHAEVPTAEVEHIRALEKASEESEKKLAEAFRPELRGP
jgi:hypothetical protein